MFSDLFRIGTALPLATLQHGAVGAIGKRDLSRHLAGLKRDDSIYWHDSVPIMLENFQRLGLVEIRYDTYLTADGTYDWVTQHPEYVRQSTIVDDMANVSILKGVARRTSFGEAFKIAAID